MKPRCQEAAFLLFEGRRQRASPQQVSDGSINVSLGEAVYRFRFEVVGQRRVSGVSGCYAMAPRGGAVNERCSLAVEGTAL
ncbi:hypothetical protein ADK75_03915 [Streptomyces virginiae]|uniref:Uncharacterized protein n=1 Tax=Streptomyces virginiae TaxID=1961 RepID=A0A0L8N4A4_STRVG|nr:hypothetical protein ADK75_03915 [Streptomyces virginiae]